MWQDEKETLAGIKRELAYTIIKRCSCWWFDMWGGFYDAPAVMDLLSKGRTLFEQWSGAPGKRVAEVVLIVDPESIYYLNQNDHERTQWFYADMKKKLARLGAPYECYHFNDIPNIPAKERIKLWVLPAVFELTPEKMALLRTQVLRDGQTALFLYAPGISDGRSIDPDRVQALCGIAFGMPGVTRVNMGDYRSVYAATGSDLTVPELKHTAVEAGVHLYVDDESPVFADARLLAVHTATGGERVVKLPRESEEVRELFSHRLVAKNCQQFAYAFQSPDTALFSY